MSSDTWRGFANPLFAKPRMAWSSGIRVTDEPSPDQHQLRDGDCGGMCPQKAYGRLLLRRMGFCETEGFALSLCPDSPFIRIGFHQISDEIYSSTRGYSLKDRSRFSKEKQ
jgi:hypothetical protein